MLLDIIKPDSGKIMILGDGLYEELKNRIGYLPEERGLYKKLTVMDTLLYLGSLKNKQCQESAIALLAKMDMLAHRDKKIQELSKGMQQKIQVIAAIIHDPEIIIFDEPFSGLDPVNMKLVQDMMLELKKAGKTILISTHMMDKVEHMCSRIFMIHRGEMVLYGSMEEIKARYGKDTILLEYEGNLKKIPGIKKINDSGNYAEMRLEEDADVRQVLKIILDEVMVSKFEISSPTLNEIFIELVEKP